MHISSAQRSILGADGVRNVSTSVLDADALTTVGTYTLSGSSQNIPESALCILTVKSINASNESSSDEVSQTVYYRVNGQIYHRTKHEGTWSNWARVDNFGCNTASDLASLLGAASWESKISSYTTPAIFDLPNGHGVYCAEFWGEYCLFCVKNGGNEIEIAHKSTAFDTYISTSISNYSISYSFKTSGNSALLSLKRMA